jgi:putative ABC transport system permease protein
MIINIIEQSLLFLPLSLGIYISYVVLRIPDLTTDGSFVLGAATYAIGIHAGLNPYLAMSLATSAAVLAGMTVSLLQTQFRLNPLIAGILLVFILNTVILKLMGKPNLSLYDQVSIFPQNGSKLMVLLYLALLATVGVALLLKSRMGLMLYAFGNNSTLLCLSGKNSQMFRMLGLSMSNGLVGFCGALTAQVNGYVDIGMGTGIILIALGTVIIGQQLYEYFFRRPSFAQLLKLIFCFIGVFIYFFVVNSLISLGLDPIYLRMMMGVCLIGFFAMTREKTRLEGVV